MAKEKLDFINQAEDTLEGFEDINAQTMAIPFLRILQKLSPACDEDSPDFIVGAKQGLFMNTVNKDLYGNTIKLIVLKFEHIYIEWEPDRGGLVDVHTPENADRIAVDHTFGAWKTAAGNDLSETYVYYVLVEGHEEEGVMILSLASSNIKKARELNRMMTSHIMDDGTRARPYYLVYEFKTERRENDKGVWFGIDFKFSSLINEKQYGLMAPERKALPGKSVDYTQIDDKAQAQANPEDVKSPY